MPFIATWKNEPSWRNGRKNDAESSTMSNMPGEPSCGPANISSGAKVVRNIVTPLCVSCQIATPMPAAAPP